MNLVNMSVAVIVISCLFTTALSAQTPLRHYPYVINDETNGTCEIVVRDIDRNEGVIAGAITTTAPEPGVVELKVVASEKLHARFKIVRAEFLDNGEIAKKLYVSDNVPCLPTLTEARLIVLLRDSILVGGQRLSDILENNALICIKSAVASASGSPTKYGAELVVGDTLKSNYKSGACSTSPYVELANRGTAYAFWSPPYNLPESPLPGLWNWRKRVLDTMVNANLIVTSAPQWDSYNNKVKADCEIIASNNDKYLFLTIE